MKPLVEQLREGLEGQMLLCQCLFGLGRTADMNCMDKPTCKASHEKDATRCHRFNSKVVRKCGGWASMEILIFDLNFDLDAPDLRRGFGSASHQAYRLSPVTARSGRVYGFNLTLVID